MTKARKSPQEKKHDEYTKDHFTFGWHSSRMFPRTWRRRKRNMNREYRRKSDELLVQVKPGMAAEEAVLLTEDLTVTQFRKSVSRTRLSKSGTVAVGEKIQRKLARREATAGRRVRSHERYDVEAASAVRTLTSLEGDELVNVVRRGNNPAHAIFTPEFGHVPPSNDPVDQALHFLSRLSAGSAPHRHALCRNEELMTAMKAWVTKANRILARDRRIVERKAAQNRLSGQKINAFRRGAPDTVR